MLTVNRRQNANWEFKCQECLLGWPPTANRPSKEVLLFYLHSNKRSLSKKYKYFFFCLCSNLLISCIVCNYVLHPLLASLVCSLCVWIASLSFLPLHEWCTSLLPPVSSSCHFSRSSVLHTLFAVFFSPYCKYSNFCPFCIVLPEVSLI